MVTVIEEPNIWADTASKFVKGASEQYEKNADQLALQKAVENLPKDAPPQDVIKAITGARTYNKAAQQEAISNVVNVEEIKRKKQESETKQQENVLRNEANQLRKAELTQRQNEAKEKREGNAETSKTSAKYLALRSNLPDEEKSQLIKDIDSGVASYDAVKTITKPTKEPVIPLAAKSTDPEQLRRIQEVRNSPEYKTASPGRKYQLMLDNGVSSNLAEKESQTSAEDEKLNRDEKIMFHKESEKYDEEISNAVKGAKNQLEAIKDSEKALNSGNVKPSSLANIFNHFGETGKAIAKAIQNKDQAVISASIPAFLEGRKELFGVRLSDADLRLLQDKLPDIGKSVEVNKAILGLMKRYSEMSLLRADVADQIKEENGGYRPPGYAKKVEKRFDEMIAPVEMIVPDPKNPAGRKVEIPAYKVSAALKKGGRLANERL